MLRIRFNLITADPPRLGDCVKYIEADVRAGVECLPGSLGTSLYMSPDTAVAIFQSFWSSRTALAQSEGVVAPARREAAWRAAGTVTVERYRVPVFELDARLFPGAGVRLNRMNIEPARTPGCGGSIRRHRGGAAGRDRRLLQRAAACRPGQRAFDQRDDLAGSGGAGGKQQRCRRGPG